MNFYGIKCLPFCQIIKQFYRISSIVSIISKIMVKVKNLNLFSCLFTLFNKVNCFIY